MIPGTLPLVVQRGTPFVYHIEFPGLDISEADFAAQVRLYKDQPGAPLINLAKAHPLAEGLSATLSTSDETGLASTLQVRINETTIENLLPFPANGTEPNERISLVWDLHMTISPIGKRRWLEGSFVIAPGVTR